MPSMLFSEIVFFHLRTNGDIYLSRWLVVVYIVLIALWAIGIIIGYYDR